MSLFTGKGHGAGKPGAPAAVLDDKYKGVAFLQIRRQTDAGNGEIHEGAAGHTVAGGAAHNPEGVAAVGHGKTAVDAPRSGQEKLGAVEFRRQYNSHSPQRCDGCTIIPFEPDHSRRAGLEGRGDYPLEGLRPQGQNAGKENEEQNFLLMSNHGKSD